MFVSENLSDLVEIINNYKKHLGDVYKLEMFYGDESLQSLMAHAKELTSTLAEIDLIIEKEEKEKTIHEKMYKIATDKYNPFSVGGSENIHDFE